MRSVGEVEDGGGEDGAEGGFGGCGGVGMAVAFGGRQRRTNRPCCCSGYWTPRVGPSCSARTTGGLSRLFRSHTNPYGRFRLDTDTRLDLTTRS
jgi:hypothetical protein